MTKRENLISLLKRKGFEEAPVEFNLCPSLVEEYKKQTGSDLHYSEYFCMPWRNVDDILMEVDLDAYRKYYPNGIKEGSLIDQWGIAHEPGSEAAKHMTHMIHPLSGIEDVEEIKKYPFLDFSKGDASHQKEQVESIHNQGLAAMGNMQMTIWETSWYLRSMEDLLVDMMSDDPIAAYILDKITEQAIIRASSYAKAGVDLLFFGDDIGMQHTILMSQELYQKWLKPRLKRVIDSVKSINPEIIVAYHSCGFIEPFIGDLIEVGVDVLNPVQSECMDFEEIYEKYGDKISFHGTIGTQTIMPFFTPEQVKEVVWRNLDLAGEKGGVFAAPTHMLEPEVPWENIIAYVEACKTYKPKK